MRPVISISRVLGLFAFVLSPAMVTAQSARWTKLSGFVLDSVTRRPVGLAEIGLRGTELTTSTGIDGRFAFSAVPVGL